MTAPPSTSSSYSTVSNSTRSTAATTTAIASPAVIATPTKVTTTTTSSTGGDPGTVSLVKSKSNKSKSSNNKSSSFRLLRTGSSTITSTTTTTTTPNNSSSQHCIQNTNNKKKKKANHHLMKLPKILSNAGKYPRARIVKDSIPLLDDELQVMTRDAPFMEKAVPDPSICLLDRKEVIVGELLGQGQFAQVYSVEDLQLRPLDKLQKDNNNNGEEIFSPEGQQKRQAFVREFHNCTSSSHARSAANTANNSSHHGGQKCHRYAIKHLKRDLLISPARRLITRRLKNNDDDDTAGGAAGGAGAIMSALTQEGNGGTAMPMEQQFQLAAADLVVEALYLSRLSHPHIVPIRGLALGGTRAFCNGRYDSYFIILDRLSETLDQRIRKWRRTSGPAPLEGLLPLKTTYAHQMALALEYLHSHRIIFRDLKPSNIGFKEQNDRLQIFDFGLCRELPRSPKKCHDAIQNNNNNNSNNNAREAAAAAEEEDDPNEVFFMTAAGTHRYMSAEVLLGQKYNAKADVYSWSMVFYELLAQEAPFLNFDDSHHQQLVCERKFRPRHFFGCVVPQSILKLLGDAWEHEIRDRLTMSQVVQRLEDILVNTFHQQTLTTTTTTTTTMAQDNNGQ